MICKVCNKEFKPRSKTSKYCCNECYLQAHKRKEVISVCLTCGKEFVVSRDTKGKYCSKECLFLYQSKVACMCTELKRNIKQLTNEVDKLKQMMYKGLLKDSILLKRKKDCIICGKTFIPKRTTIICCSSECSKHYSQQQKDKRIYKNGKPDLSITLHKLYQRDKGICNICGIVCDWQDIEVREDGTLVAGNNYPSIDHIIPIAKGGKHEWNNVQLLCRYCNTIKRDK